MQNVELYILDSLVQLKGSENIALTLRANDIAQLNSIVSNYTTGFKILPTKDNETLTVNLRLLEIQTQSN
jgi:hypothetical protein